MEDTQPQGPFCQSCAMPLKTDEDFGTEADGGKSEKFCRFCYVEGTYTTPEMTMEEMIEISAKGWADSDPNVSYEQAFAEMEKIAPYLERWQ